MSVATQAAIPATLFDELKKRADAAGGIGYGSSPDRAEPRCIGDFARAIDAEGRVALPLAGTALQAALGEYFGTLNDSAVRNINYGKGIVPFGWGPWGLPRVSFDELVAELGLVRGEA